VALGQPVTLTATVSPSGAGGKVTFYDGVTILGQSTLVAGRAALTTSFLPFGPRVLRAYYSGDASHPASLSATLPETVHALQQNGPSIGGSYNADTQPVSIAVGDFNGDGIPDMVVANSLSDDISVLLGNGDGTFGDPANYTLTANSVVVGDFNGDGNADLAVAFGGDFLSVLLGNGDGTFQSPVNLAVGSSGPGTISSSVVVGDFNGDGIADLAVASSNFYSGSAGNYVSVLLGNGDGTFQTAVNTAAGKYTSAVAVGDFNGDGVADLAFVGPGTSVAVLLGSGDGTFQTPANYAIGSYASSLAVGDFNGDGKADLAVGSRSGVSLLLGNGDGTFQTPMSLAIGVAVSVAVGDFNGDGKADLLVGFSGAYTGDEGIDGGIVSLLLGNGDGTFQPPLNYGGGSLSIVVADFNRDGKTDFAFAYPGDDEYFFGNVWVALGGGAAQIVTFPPLSNQTYGVAPFSITVASNSGFSPTVITTTPAVCTILGGSYDLVTIVGAGTCSITASAYPVNQFAPAPPITQTFTVFQAPQTITIPTLSDVVLGTAPFGIGATASSGLQVSVVTTTPGVCTITGDDVISISATGVCSVTASQSGNADYLAAVSVTQSFMVNAVTRPSTIRLTSSVNPANLGQPVTLTATVSPAGVTGGKVTFYDGTSMLGTRALSSGQAALTTALLGSGAGSLRAYYSGGSNYPASVSAVQTETINALPSDGFRAAVNYALPYNSIYILAGDFNGDGKADLATISNGNPSILLGNGDGTFQTAANFEVGPASGCSPQSVVMGDFNGDGKADLAVISRANDALSVLLGNGDGTFQPAMTYPLASTGVLIVGDFNGDGKTDLAFPDGTNLSVLLGNGDGTFRAPVHYGSSTAAVVVGDFNGDGKTDVAATSYGNATGTVSILLGTTFSKCDIGRNGNTTVSDVQSVINEALGVSTAVHDLNSDGVVNVVDVQIVLNAAVGLGCITQ
jgi:hypothetical protein